MAWKLTSSKAVMVSSSAPDAVSEAALLSPTSPRASSNRGHDIRDSVIPVPPHPVDLPALLLVQASWRYEQLESGDGEQAPLAMPKIVGVGCEHLDLQA
jgi:hypothetical protein